MAEKNFRKRITQMEKQISALNTEAKAAAERLKKTESNRDEYKSKYLQFKGIFNVRLIPFTSTSICPRKAEMP